MWNLRISMILYAAILMAEGIVMWLDPAGVAKLLGFNIFDSMAGLDATNFVSYIFSLMGAALIAGGFVFIVGSVNPKKNVNVVRFAILWSALTLAGEIYSIVKGYVTFGSIWSVRTARSYGRSPGGPKAGISDAGCWVRGAACMSPAGYVRTTGMADVA